jgi:hypothetical protein
MIGILAGVLSLPGIGSSPKSCPANFSCSGRQNRLPLLLLIPELRGVELE